MDRYLVLLLVLNFIIINNFNYLIKKFNIYDSPNIKRKKQSYKVSTAGGLIIIINFFSFFLYDILFGLTDSVFSSYRNQFSLYFCGILIYFVGIFDDKYGVSNSLGFMVGTDIRGNQNNNYNIEKDYEEIYKELTQ